MRSLFAGVAVLVLAGACAMSPEATSASMTTESVKSPVAIESKFATSPDGTKIHYNASGAGPLVIASTWVRRAMSSTGTSMRSDNWRLRPASTIETGR